MLIGLTGKARSGKDTAAQELRPYFIRVAFATPMRDMLRALDIDYKYSDGALKERVIPELGVSYRRMMQTLGTEWGRSLAEDFWIRLAARRIAELEAFGHPDVVITDVRFDNEAEWIKRRGGRVIRIVRDDAPAVAAHASEAGVAEHWIDATIHNVGTVDDLHRSVRLIVMKLMVRVDVGSGHA